MRKNSRSLALLALAAGMTLASCSDDSPWNGSSDEGGIDLTLNTDGRVMRQTRADDGVSPVIPTANSFAINLAKSDGSYSKDWSSLEGFNREKSFPIGDYTLSATYGDMDKEGFDNPYYAGKAEVHVAPGAETAVNVTATLGNAMTSIRYTDEFKQNFPAYSAAVQTEGHDWVIFAQNETRPAYIAPGEVAINLTLTNDEGQRVTIQPAGFTATARHHYVVTIGVAPGNEKGELALDIQFDEDVVAETVSVSLGDDLFNAPAPSVKANGFTVGTPVEAFESAEPTVTPKFDIFAFGGLKEVWLNIVSDSYNPSFGNKINLMAATPLEQQQIANDGIDAAGFFKNPDKMGVINIKGLLEKLPVGSHEIEVYAVDVQTRKSESIIFNTTIKPVEMELSAPAAAEFLANEISVDINTNCPDIKNNVSFKAPNANNQMVDVKVKSITEVSSPSAVKTRADLGHTFRYVLDVTPMATAAIDVEAYLGSKKRTVQVVMNAPEYEVAADAFAKKVVLKIDAANDKIASYVHSNAVFYNGTAPIPTANIKYDQASGLTTIYGLTSATTYENINIKVAEFNKTVPAFTTEAETDVTNGSFASVIETIHIEGILTGGDFTGTIFGSPKYHHTTNIVRSEPTGWASVNALTCDTRSTTQNTWFMVPSTFAENEEVVIRSVGYNHAGSNPGVTKVTARYYNDKSIADTDLNKAAGELFLGSYPFDNSSSRVDGISWTTRPSQISFDYKYTSVNNERGLAYIRIIDAAGKVISEQEVTLTATSSFVTKTVNLENYPFGVKAAKIQLGFKSSTAATPAINIPSGSALSNGGGLHTYNLCSGWGAYGAKSANDYKAFATGSELTVDNVKLGYDTPGITVKARRK